MLPRRTAFVRKAADSVATEQVVAANVDVALLVASMNADLNARRLERYLATAWQSGAKPVVVLTKADLAEDPDARHRRGRERRLRRAGIGGLGRHRGGHGGAGRAI